MFTNNNLKPASQAPRLEEDAILEKEIKLVKDRLDNSEKSMAKLFLALKKYSNRTAKYRDSNDELATALNSASSREVISNSLRVCMGRLAQSLAHVGDHRDNSTLYLEDHVLGPLQQYEGICKQSASVIKNINSAVEERTKKRRALTKIRRRLPQNMSAAAKAEGELAQACSKVAQLQLDLEKYALAFEKEKLHHLKRVLHDFIKAELSFHIGAVEHLSKAVSSVNEIDVAADFQSFKNVLVCPNLSLRLDIVRNSCVGGHRNLNADAGIPGGQDTSETKFTSSANDLISEPTPQDSGDSSQRTALNESEPSLSSSSS